MILCIQAYEPEQLNRAGRDVLGRDVLGIEASLVYLARLESLSAGIRCQSLVLRSLMGQHPPHLTDLFLRGEVEARLIQSYIEQELV